MCSESTLVKYMKEYHDYALDCIGYSTIIVVQYKLIFALPSKPGVTTDLIEGKKAGKELKQAVKVYKSHTRIFGGTA